MVHSRCSVNVRWTDVCHVGKEAQPPPPGRAAAALPQEAEAPHIRRGLRALAGDIWVRVSAHRRLWEVPSHLENEGVEFNGALLVLTNYQTQPQAESQWLDPKPRMGWIVSLKTVCVEVPAPAPLHGTLFGDGVVADMISEDEVTLE